MSRDPSGIKQSNSYQYHTTFVTTIPLPKRIKKAVNTTPIPVKLDHCCRATRQRRDAVGGLSAAVAQGLPLPLLRVRICSGAGGRHNTKSLHAMAQTEARNGLAVV